MRIFIWIYMLFWIFFSAEAKLLWETWEDCSIDFIYKTLLILWVLCTWVGMLRLEYKFFLWILFYILAYLLKVYVKHVYKERNK